MNTKFLVAAAAFITFTANATTIYDGACEHALRCEPAAAAEPPPVIVAPPPVVFVCEGEVVSRDNGVVECRIPDPSAVDAPPPSNPEAALQQVELQLDLRECQGEGDAVCPTSNLVD